MSDACGYQFVAGAAAAGRAADEDAAVDQIADVAIGRVLGTAVHPRPFRRGELALEAVQQPVEGLRLAWVEGFGGMGFPEPGLVQDGGKRGAGVFDGAGGRWQASSSGMSTTWALLGISLSPPIPENGRLVAPRADSGQPDHYHYPHLTSEMSAG